ncbi:MAG: hypothetical protein PHH08_04345 [Candidatus ainarchaeum sp.]|nr:hypothetical protein [Candidatus ainarchaeum sp.]
MPTREGYTTIELKKSTRDKLVEMGRKNQSYDDLILELIEVRQKKSNKK